MELQKGDRIFTAGNYIENVSNLPNGDNSDKNTLLPSIFLYIGLNRRFELDNSIYMASETTLRVVVKIILKRNYSFKSSEILLTN